MNVTLRDLARAAGVSASTVSRVLRNSHKVHTDSREKVHRAVKKLGYRHNPLVDAWATRFRESHRQSGMVLAHVVGFSQAEIAGNAVLGAIQKSILSRAADLDISIAPFVLKSDGNMGISRLRRILFHRGIDAVLWGPFPAATTFRVAADWDFSMVGVGISNATQSLHRVVHNRYLSMRHICTCLQEFERPGLVGFGPKNSAASHGWLQAFYLHTAQLSAKNRIPWLPLPQMDFAVFRNWMDRHKPDVVISPFQEMREMVLENECEFFGLNLAEEGLDDGIKGITHPSSAIGCGAVDLLLAQCDWNESGAPTHPRQTAWEGALVGFREDQPESSKQALIARRR